MKILIQFHERPIYRAPLAVLEHLYYYTHQYGLSVRQFTGEHWKYWEKLPERLREAASSPAELDALITELEILAAGSHDRRRKRQAQIEGRWSEKEIVLNAQLLSVLAALPDELLAVGFGNLMAGEDLPQSVRIVDLEMQGEHGEHVDFVEPDLLLLGGHHLLMVEIKTRGSSRSSRDYPPHQLLNYLHLVATCRDFGDYSAPSHFAHVILVPSAEPRWLEKYSEWVLETNDERGQLKVDSDACINLSKRKDSYDYDVLADLASEIPIYYRSWQQLYEAFDAAIQQFDDPRNDQHWHKILGEIKALARKASRHID